MNCQFVDAQPVVSAVISRAPRKFRLILISMILISILPIYTGEPVGPAGSRGHRPDPQPRIPRPSTTRRLDVWTSEPRRPYRSKSNDRTHRDGDGHAARRRHPAHQGHRLRVAIRKGFRKKWAVWDQEKTASLLYPVGRGWRMGSHVAHGTIPASRRSNEITRNSSPSTPTNTRDRDSCRPRRRLLTT